MCLIITLILMANSVSAAITVRYTPVNTFVFMKGGSPGAEAFESNKFVLPIGTLTFDSDEPYYDPTIYLSDNSTHFWFYGPTIWNPTTGDPTAFRMARVSTIGSKTTMKMLDWGTGGDSLATTNNMAITQPQFIAYLYLVSDQDASVYIENSVYDHTSGDFGAFTVAIANTSAGHSNGVTLLPVEGTGSATQPTDILIGGITAIPPLVPYGDPDRPISFALSLINQRAFDIERAYTGLPPVHIATAQVTLSNAVSGRTYGVNVTFTNNDLSDKFHVHLEGNPLQAAIEYSLVFGTTEVEKNQPIPWKNMTTGIFERDILVTGISEFAVQSAPQGPYTDTVIVTITPSDFI